MTVAEFLPITDNRRRLEICVACGHQHYSEGLCGAEVPVWVSDDAKHPRSAVGRMEQAMCGCRTLIERRPATAPP
jgi:hypothetical protein